MNEIMDNLKLLKEYNLGHFAIEIAFMILVLLLVQLCGG
jgi:hypothetical protein